MKHIKYFNESNDSKEYYQKIHSDEFFELSIIDIDDKYVNILKTLIGKERVSTDRYDNGYYRQLIINISSDIAYPGFGAADCATQIYQLEDEWFVVDIFNLDIQSYGWQFIFYKCDQWQGVLQCLKDNGFIK